MFDVGFSELLIIAVVALLVLGPERLPKAARFAGLWVRKARAQWYAVKSELELELAQEEMKKHLQAAENSIQAPAQAIQSELRQAGTELDDHWRALAAATEAPTAAVPDPAPAEDDNAGTPAQRSASAEAGADGDDPQQGRLW